ncbi:hypothetical protein [Roseobacter sp.]|uniref:hypothetical protein n=1 Tax=Roseobacter sp. TaxID=1907202 RepID=UPI00385BEB0A
MRQSCFLLFALILVLCVVGEKSTAQQAGQPLVELELDQAETIPSQPIALRITVLVPTWLSKPVEFPSFEAPNLMVRLFENATNPTSRPISGETWSGVTRVYHLYPMVPGPFQIGAQDLRILWAEPGVTEPKESIVQTDPIEILAKLPEGSEDIDPFFAATDVLLTQELSQDTNVLKPGDSFTRNVTATITGASPMFLPKLLQDADIEGIASYPSEPQVNEEIKGIILSGSRTEEVTLIAQSGGSGQLPAIEVKWFNLQTGAVETAKVPGVDLSVDAPAASSQTRFDTRALVMIAVYCAAAMGIGWVLVSWVRPPLRRHIDEWKSSWVLSERWAFKQATKALDQRDLGAFLNQLDLWASRCTGYDPRNDEHLSAAVSRINESRYGLKKQDPGSLWSAARVALLGARRSAHGRTFDTYDPSSINPLPGG